MNIIRISATIFIFALLIFSACKPDEPELNDEWNVQVEQVHNQIIELQDLIGNDFETGLLEMDSLDALEKAYESFVASSLVESATISSQGISVQYDNGMRGGLFLRGKDDKSQETGVMQSFTNQTLKNGDLKSVVNKRKMILINPHYYERSYFADQIFDITRGNISRAGYELSAFYKNNEARVDRFTELSGYGIVQIYSHGWAWPKEKNITDVYLLTGETANTTTSKKYWSELKTGNIPIMKIAGANKYLISPAFIQKHNDFSKDTVLFYGGFCYSFLGDWPDIIESFADGAYVGFDWSVYTFRNANWAVNSMAMMSDTSKATPFTLEQWMKNTEVEKSYDNPDDNRVVEIQYVGDGKLTLWNKVKVDLIALSSDGAPVSEPGEAGTAYSFRCDVVTTISPIEYVWDIGDGSSATTTQGSQVNITWSQDGNYTLTVSVKNKNNGEVIGKASLGVTIGSNDEIIKAAQKCTYIECFFGPGSAVQYSPEVSGNFGGISWKAHIVWTGLSFSGSDTTYSSKNEIEDVYEITGTLSNDGKKVSFTAYNELFGYVRTTNSYSISVSNLPFNRFDPDPYYASSPILSYLAVEASTIKNYITNFEGWWYPDVDYNPEDGPAQNHTVAGIKWDEANSLHLDMFEKETN
jgi:hypothetical protein